MVANGNASSCWEFTAGVPQEVFGPFYYLVCIVVNLAIRFCIVTYFNMLMMYLL